MKRFNRILAALIAVLMLCGACTTVAEMDVDLTLDAQGNPGSIELEIDPEAWVDEPDGGLELDDGLQMEGIELLELNPEIEIQENLLTDGAEEQEAELVQSNDSDSDFVIKNGVLVEYKGDGGDVVIPDGVKSIGESAFHRCENLTSVTIPASVISIKVNPFGYCSNLLEIIVDSDNLNYASLDGVLYSHNMKTLLCCPGGKTDVIIPAKVNRIEDEAFWGDKHLTSVSIPNSVTYIGDFAFQDCKNLTNVSISDSVTIIRSMTFRDCIELTEVVIPDNVTTIEEEAFCGCTGLTSVTIPDSVTKIDKTAFHDYDGYDYVPLDLTIYGYKGSYAETYAQEEGFEFSEIDKPTETKLNRTYLNLVSGGTFALRVINPVDQTITWASSDTTVASVDNGKVTAKKVGKCVISATLENGKTLNCDVTVYDPAEISDTTLKLKLGGAYVLKVTGLLKRTVTWTSSDTTVATVKNGKITPKKEGKCTITAKLGASQYLEAKTLTCKVTVTDDAELSKTSLALNAGKTAKLTVKNLAGRAVTWETSNKNVATVKAGTVTATGGGRCTITAKVKNGKTLKCAVSVTDRAKLYEYDSESEDYDWYYDYSSKSEYYEKKCKPIKSASLDIGETLRLVVTYTAGRKVVWSSSNTKVATVNNGKVTPTGGGKCTITAKVGGKSLSCKLTVTDTAKLSETSLSLKAGETHKLTIDKLAGRKVTWTSSDRKVATVKDGVVTAVYMGKCTITAQIKNGKKLTCKLTVTDPAVLSETTLSLQIGSTHTLTIDGLLKRKVTWTSSNTAIATVNNGKITAIKEGKCTITAQIKNGKKLTCKLTVTDPASLSAEKLTISTIDSDRIKLTGALKRKVTWSTSDDGVVKITKSDSSAASIKAVKTGTATITAKIEGGKPLKCAVTVVNPLTIKEDWDDDFDDLASWEVGVKFTNHSNKKIIYVTFDILQYNNRGDRLKSPYDYYYFNNDLKPHSSYWDNYQVNDDTRSVKFKITEVTFADKTTWRP